MSGKLVERDCSLFVLDDALAVLVVDTEKILRIDMSLVGRLLEQSRSATLVLNNAFAARKTHNQNTLCGGVFLCDERLEQRDGARLVLGHAQSLQAAKCAP